MSARIEPGSWLDRAWRTIDHVHSGLAETISFEDRKKAIDEAYPFGERRYTPYKMWLKARRGYLARYDERPAGPLAPLPMSPLERQKARAEARATPAFLNGRA